MNYREPGGRQRRKTFERRPTRSGTSAQSRRTRRAACTSTPTRAGSPSGSTPRNGSRTRRPSRQLGSGSKVVAGARLPRARVEDARADQAVARSSRGFRASRVRRARAGSRWGPSRRSWRPPLTTSGSPRTRARRGRCRTPKPEAKKVVPWAVERVAAVRSELPERYRIAVDPWRRPRSAPRRDLRPVARRCRLSARHRGGPSSGETGQEPTGVRPCQRANKTQHHSVAVLGAGPAGGLPRAVPGQGSHAPMGDLDGSRPQSRSIMTGRAGQRAEP